MLIRNTAANLAGQLLYPILALVLVPFYVQRLGLEGYGLIGLLTLTVSLLSVFTRGAGSALQREIGRRTGSEDAATLRRLLRSFEVFYWILGGVMAAALAAAALTAGPRWIRTEHLSPAIVTACLVLLAIRAALAIAQSVYQAVFVGTERQVLGSTLNAAAALVSAAAGVVAILSFRSVVAFYAAEVATAAVFLMTLRRYAWRTLPDAPAAFEGREIRNLLGISLALIWTSGVGLLITNLDRLVVSAALPVSALAVYTVAVMGGRLVQLVFNPFLQAAYPRMCRVARSESSEEQVRDLLRNAAVMVVGAAAVALPLAAFAGEVLAVWVRDPHVVREGAPVLAVYSFGSLLIALASVFYQWQTATGRTGVAVTFNAIALLWFPPLLWALVARTGLVGAAIAWAIYAALTWITTLVSTFRQGRLPQSGLQQYLRLTAAGLAPAIAATLVFRVVASTWFPEDLWIRTACAALAGASGGAAALAIGWPHIRRVRDAPAPPVAPLIESPLSNSGAP